MFSAFLPEHARDVGLGGSGSLFAAYSVVCLALRFAGARWLERLGARRAVLHRVRIARPRARRPRPVPGPRPALWISALLIGVASAFLYPSLMALTVNRADERERPMAISSFTMFFEVGNIAVVSCSA